ncbi:MAG TPA: sensor histidine kinase [Thermomicrobiales bacterium]|nr:sensor histidine kinase [Thermomicrobiales bacterium]
MMDTLPTGTEPGSSSPPVQDPNAMKAPFKVNNEQVQRMLDDPHSLWTQLRNLPGVRSWRVLSDGLFLLTSFPLGLIWFLIAVIGLTVGGALAIVGIGFVILGITFATLIWAAQVERTRLRVFLDVNVAPRIPISAYGGNVVQKTWRYLKSPQVWRDMIYLMVLFPIGIVELALVLLPLELLWAPFMYSAFGHDNVLFWDINNGFEAFLSFVLGVILVVPLSFLINIVASLHGQLGVMMLGVSKEEEMLHERVSELTESRSAVMRAMHMERRRIERDLHDGAQQRLVSLAMDLGRAREKMDTDPEGARKIIDESHEQAKQVLTEMRDLVRGIHPAVLTDRGLDAAISAIAGRAPVPVRVDVDLDERLPEEVEGTAYFVVVEALTNIARHGDATQAWVQVRREGNWLRVTVTDDGRGGADPDKGTGLRGLRDRIAALDGSFALTSPVGRGTRLTVEIPCVS